MAHGSGGAAASGRAVHAGHHPRAVVHADCSMVLQTGYSNWGLAGYSMEHLAAHSSQGPLVAHPTCPHGYCSRVGNGVVHLGGVGTEVAQGAAVDPKGQLDEADQTKGACLAGSDHGGQDLEGQQLQDPGHLPRCHTLKNQASGWEACCHLTQVTGSEKKPVSRRGCGSSSTPKPAQDS